MYTTKEVSVEGTEIEFITTFVNELMAADGNITCQTDITAEFADTANTPKIILNIAGMGVLHLTRSKSLSDGTASYTFDLLVNGASEATATMTFNGNVASGNIYDKVVTRKWKFVVHKQENFRIIKLSSYSQSVKDTYSLCFVSINNENMNLCMPKARRTTNSNFYLDGNLIRIDDAAKGITCKFAARLPYRNYDGSVEIIKNKVLLVDDVYYYTFSGFYDCSYVPKDSIVTIDNVNYIALDEHTLAKM